MSPETLEKLQRMREFLGGFKKVVIAFSGGVDSSTLAAVCKDAGLDVLAVTVISQKSPSKEIKEAEKIAGEIGVKHEFINLDILTPEFRKNSPERCYFCKRRVLSSLISLADERGYDAVFEGTNASDLEGHRPGYKAVIEMQRVHSPWAEFGITKEEIRSIAKSMGFSFYDKPSLACLASRISFGIEIDEKKLKMVDEAENLVIEIAGIKQVRVRNYNGVAVLEVGEEEVEEILQKLEMEAKTAVLVASDGKIVGAIGIADTIKDSARETIEELHRMGKKVIMITGDNRRTAEAIAKKLGVDVVLSEVLPNQKAEEVRMLQMQGEVVAFVGDGINDAPALAQADIGIAMGSGTDVALESGEIVLMKDELRGVVAAIQLSEKTLGKIKQNIFWAMIYNTLLIPAAAGVPYPLFGIIFRPEWGGFAMTMSSVSVVSNSLLMKNYVPPILRKKKGGGGMEKIVLKLEGLSCNHCIMRVTKALESAGAKVESVTLDEAVIFGEKEKAEKYVAAVEEAGYKARVSE